MSKIDYIKNSEIFKALSNPIRLQMVDFLLDDECCVTDVVSELGISQSAASQHLSILKSSGIVYPEKHGTRTCYKVGNKLAEEIIKLIKNLQ